MIMTRGVLLVCLMALQAVPALGQVPADDQLRERDLIRASRAGRAALPATVPRGYALVIGISNYKNLDATQQLEFAESDAAAILRTLISPEGGAFPAENVKTLIGPNATLANIRDALENWLPAKAQADDRVVVFFAGHGFVEKGRGYLAPYDVDPDQLATTGYPMSAVGDVLATKVKARWKVLLTDACHSGKVNAETTNEALDQQFSSLPANFLTLTATTEREQSHEDRKLGSGFGFFSYFLSEGMAGHADNDPCDGRITADEIVEYVRSNVRRHAREKGVFQTPTARGDYEPDMLLGVRPSCLSSGGVEPSSFGRAIVETASDGAVDVYLDGELKGQVSKGRPLVLPGLAPGPYEFKGVQSGYEPDTKQIMVVPGQDVAVTIRIRYVRQIKKGALDLNDQGERLLHTIRSSVNPLNIVVTKRTQSTEDLERARMLFNRALAEEPSFVMAAYNLGQTEQLLGDQKASLAAFRAALAADPSFVRARISYAAVLIESGDADAAIRELNDAIRLDAENAALDAMLARAYWEKAAWARAVEYADKALALEATNAQAHLWRAEGLRFLSTEQPERRLALLTDARTHYHEFLRLTNFSSSFFSRAAYHFVGHGVGSRRHADRHDAYVSLRIAGYLGLCITEQRVGLLRRAREYCEKALDYDERQPITHFVLGNVNRDLYNQDPACNHLLTARRHYGTMVTLNGELQEARNAKNYLEQISGILRELKCRGG
jgi:tetratricopeptide (TPR) repeat protein